jgi:hypothetical protein
MAGYLPYAMAAGRQALDKDGMVRNTLLPTAAKAMSNVPYLGKALGMASQASDFAKRFGFGKLGGRGGVRGGAGGVRGGMGGVHGGAGMYDMGGDALRTGGSRRMKRQYGPRALARHQAMRMFAADGHPLGHVSKMAAAAVRRAERTGEPIEQACQHVRRGAQ